MLELSLFHNIKRHFLYLFKCILHKMQPMQQEMCIETDRSTISKQFTYQNR